HTPQAAHGVEDLVALAVPDVDALGPCDHARAAPGQLAVVGEGVDVVRAVQRLDGPGVLLFGAAHQGGRGNQGRGVHRRLSGQTWSSRCSRSQGEITFMNSSNSSSLISV